MHIIYSMQLQDDSEDDNINNLFILFLFLFDGPESLPQDPEVLKVEITTNVQTLGSSLLTGNGHDSTRARFVKTATITRATYL